MFIAFLCAVSSAQVDTLQLMEIGSIQAPSGITELYVEDLDGDSLKEIIICTDYYVYIYDSQTYQVEWTSPPLNQPMDLLFEDINCDGLIDLSIQDSTNIHLFDPHTPQTIWTSPPLDSTYKCYTIGDRNEDDWIDIAIVRKELFSRYQYPDNMDTVWVEVYDGPSFTGQMDFISLLLNINCLAGNYHWWDFEVPTSVCINRITGSGGNESRISMFTITESGYYGIWGPNFFGYVDSGWLRIFDSHNLGDSLMAAKIGYLLHYNHQELDDTIFLNAVTSHRDSNRISTEHNWKVNTSLADSVTYSDYIYYWWSTSYPHTVHWRGFVINDFNDINSGLENCYSAEDTLVLLSFPEIDTLWMREATDIDSVLYRFTDSSLYNSPQIICAIGDPLIRYQFFSGSDGSLSAIMPDSGYELSRVSDLDNDRRDEILSIQGSSLYIYNLDYATGTGDDSKLPHRAFLRHNYPNPFNSATTIEYGLPEAGQVRIDIYDLLGRKVETLVDEEMRAGRHRVVWDASGYSSGVYFYRIETGDFVDTKRMVYLK